MFEKPITPSTIGTTTFRIPLYQRPYAWEESQVTRLLSDLYDAFQEGQQSGEPTDYHIGILSIARTRDDRGQYDLIDGQQRISTLLLIGRAARSHSDLWNQFLSAGRLELYGRNEDKRFLNGESTMECNRRMVDAVHYADAFFASKSDPKAFAEYIYEHAAFFLSEVPSSYSLLDKNQQFVRMNNRGKQLEKHEILKVQLLSRIKDKEKRAEAFKIWNAMLACLTGMSGTEIASEETLERILLSNAEGSEATGDEVLYTSMLSVPEFLLIALARFLSSSGRETGSFNTDKLLETFSALKDEENIINFMSVLQKQVEVFRSFFIFLSKQDKYEFGGTNNTESNDFDFGTDRGLKDRLIAVQSFLYVSTEPHHWMIPAFDWCQSQVKPINSEAFIAQLEKIDASITREKKRTISPTDDLESLVFGSHISRYWFYRLDYELWKRFQVRSAEGKSHDDVWSKLPNEKLIKDLIEKFRFRHCGSVEHIVPQRPMEAPKDAKPDHSFGNLALISSSRNSKFSNNAPEGKMAIILQSGYTESLKMLHFLTCDSNSRSHGETMFGILEKISRV